VAELLKASNVTYAPPDQPAPIFSNVSLSLNAGEFALLRGPSGCGKSSFMRTVVGLEARRSGDIFWLGKPVVGRGFQSLRSNAVYVHQQPASVGLTVADNLAFPRMLCEQADVPCLRSEEQTALLKRLDLWPLAGDKIFATLSVGEQQRLCLVRALSVCPRVILLDEPITALDDARAERLLSVIAEFVNNEPDARAALMVSHQSPPVDGMVTKTINWADLVGADA
jgi:putative ABC transport system ATP-binding protein